MSSDAPVPIPRTAVPLGITDPVLRAREELKATLAAIEVKANVPRRLSEMLPVARARFVSRIGCSNVEGGRLSTIESRPS